MSLDVAVCAICGIQRQVKNSRRPPARCRDCMRYGRAQPTPADALPPGHWRKEPGGIWRWIAHPQPAPDPIQCGTYRGYRKHRRASETACDDCRQAFALWRREERAQQREAA